MQKKWIGVVGFTLVLYFWIQYLFADIYNFHCHIDVDQWKEATNGIFRGDYEDAADRDRPLLMIFLASLWMDYGFPALDALLLNTRIAWVVCMTCCFAWATQMYSVRAAVLSIVFLLWSHSYSALVVSVTGQIPFNAFVALHLFLGFSLARSAKWWSWMGLGFLTCLLPLCKEQGFFFPFLSLFFLLYSSDKGWKKRFSRVFFFSLGSAPLIGILYWWQMMIWTHGQKYQDLLFDLRLLHQEESFLGKSQALLHWGSIEVTFQSPSGYADLFYKAWLRLTNEIGVHLLIGLALLPLAFLIARFTDRKCNGAALLWTLLHILPAVPLFALLLIEPYHLSFLEVPAAGLFAWACFYLLPNAPALSKDGWPLSVKSWYFVGSIGICIGLGIALVRGQIFVRAMPWEIGSCLTERLIPVMQYARNNPAMQNSTVFVTDNAMHYSKTLPFNWKVAPSGKELHQLRCEEDFVVVTSKKTSGYVLLSDLFHPNQWQKSQEIPSINNENWWVFEGKCR